MRSACLPLADLDGFHPALRDVAFNLDGECLSASRGLRSAVSLGGEVGVCQEVCTRPAHQAAPGLSPPWSEPGVLWPDAVPSPSDTPPIQHSWGGAPTSCGPRTPSPILSLLLFVVVTAPKPGPQACHPSETTPASLLLSGHPWLSSQDWPCLSCGWPPRTLAGGISEHISSWLHSSAQGLAPWGSWHLVPTGARRVPMTSNSMPSRVVHSSLALYPHPFSV